MSDVFYNSDPALLQLNKWEHMDPKLRVGFSTRLGGNSRGYYNSLNLGLHVADDYNNVIANRELVSKKLTFPLSNWVSGEQIHQTTIKIVTYHDKGKGSTLYKTALKGMDGLITKEQGILCVMSFADCIPLYFFDPSTSYIGIAHAGWRGTVNRIAEKMVKKLALVGVRSRNLLVAIGPGISQEKYEIDESVFNQISREERGKTVIYRENNRFLLDLKQLNVEILLQSGILRNNIDVSTYCTFKNDDLFFSHRREDGKTGRMLGYIGYMKENV